MTEPCSQQLFLKTIHDDVKGVGVKVDALTAYVIEQKTKQGIFKKFSGTIGAVLLATIKIFK